MHSPSSLAPPCSPAGVAVLIMVAGITACLEEKKAQAARPCGGQPTARPGASRGRLRRRPALSVLRADDTGVIEAWVCVCAGVVLGFDLSSLLR